MKKHPKQTRPLLFSKPATEVGNRPVPHDSADWAGKEAAGERGCCEHGANIYLPTLLPGGHTGAESGAKSNTVFQNGAGGGTRTHTTLPSRDFKSLASTSSATSASLIYLEKLPFSCNCFAGNPLLFCKSLFMSCPSPVRKP
jgi:hypothetical protein